LIRDIQMAHPSPVSVVKKEEAGPGFEQSGILREGEKGIVGIGTDEAQAGVKARG
jgi:hypothetical protein